MGFMHFRFTDSKANKKLDCKCSKPNSSIIPFNFTTPSKPLSRARNHLREKIIKFFFGGALSLIIVPSINLAFGSEFDILAEDEPKTKYFLDDANVLSRTSRDEINNKLLDLFQRTGFKFTVITVRSESCICKTNKLI